MSIATMAKDPPKHQNRSGRESTTTDGKPPAPGLENAAAPQPKREDGQHGAYWVLTEEERAKGFVRPVRATYRHVGPPKPANLRDLTDEEKARHHPGLGYVKFEPYGEDKAPVTGRFWTQEMLDRIGKGCGTTTTMARSIAETYAAQPDYYGSTFCVACGGHFRVGEHGEFVWDGTTERVGS